MVRGADSTRIAHGSLGNFIHAHLVWIVLALAALNAPVRGATIAISLPLQGHYHPGRYMPVRISGQIDGPGDVLTLRGNGALPAEIRTPDGHINALLPWLSIRTISDVLWSTSTGGHAVDLPLHALDNDDDRLIGYVGADADALAPFFPGKKLYRVELDVTDPLPGEITAWEALDGLVLDSSAAGITEAKIRGLLAGGTAIAIRSRQKPNDNWPWRRQGEYWIAHVDIAGAETAHADPITYLPAESWVRGWPYDFRRTILLAAVIFVILASAATLWRSRWSVLVVVALGAIATGLAIFWRHRQPVGIERSWSVIVRTDRTTQQDQWTYEAVLRAAEGSFPCPPLTRPVFVFRGQEEEFSVRELCAANGKPLAFAYHLRPGQSLAFQTRFLAADRKSLAPELPVTPALQKMADETYALHGDRIVGQLSTSDELRWPDVVIDRPAAAP